MDVSSIDRKYAIVVATRMETSLEPVIYLCSC